MANLPRGASNEAFPLTPNSVPLVTYYNSGLSTSSEYLLTLNPSTTFLRVVALDNPVVIKWATGVANTSTNFDQIILPGGMLDLFIPSGVKTASFLSAGSAARVWIIQM